MWKFAFVEFVFDSCHNELDTKIKTDRETLRGFYSQKIIEQNYFKV